ncbi:MAG: pyridoxamine 5'-phosphate oxidase family protein [Thermaerobacter sp.]|nr:pyridoxamine 5'-phosphate oxidase family protein [Thermaerobacter sp.]
MLDATAKSVLEGCEVVAIATQGPDGPHLVATWGEYVRRLGIAERLLIPVGTLRATEENLSRDPRVVLLAGSLRVPGRAGPGQGVRLTGPGRIVTAGADAERVRQAFPWARGALAVQVTRVESLL